MNVLLRRLTGADLYASAFTAFLMAILVAVGVTACSSSASLNQSILQTAQTIITLDQGLKGALTNLSALNVPGLTAAKVQTIQTALTEINTAATNLQTTAATNTAQSQVQQVEGAVNTIVATLAGMPLPATIQMPLAAAAVLLPVAENTIGLVVSQIAANNATNAKTIVAGTIKAPAMTALSPAMLDAQARAILLRAAAR